MIMKMIAAGVLLASLTSADTLTGYLVDANCYDREERNTRPVDRDTNHDRDYEIRACVPSSKTKTFEIVDRNGQSLKLDATGAAQAAELLKQPGAKRPFQVTVTGSRSGDTFKTDSISVLK
jgi:hypothetical protein